MYTTLALDLDGTLTTSTKEITVRTKEAVQRAYDKGVHIVLASGRPVLGIVPVARRLGLLGEDATILAYNGGQLVSTRNLEVIRERTVDLNTIHTCFTYAKEHRLAALSYDEQGVITEMPDDPYVGLEAYNNAIPIRKVDDLIAEVRHPMPKVMIVGEPARLLAAKEALTGLVGNHADLGFSDPFFMEITAQGVQKASSLVTLLSLLGHTEQDLMVIGDGLNDVPMFGIAGLAVAMDNASDEVKAHAHTTTASNNEDGAAKAIECHILSQ
ncbi:Cof-type HAD-IIB family hydrolase [uncultured Sphaerochaeta sp.]|uniref:Cof-type HAD-IIB family hydrolase n=1 Tax=uncultured Sphaerochaeta sp. TaxID=886478 RepID=UPI00261C77B4|nr:Cof-type HAD-IIB family hydrolase [uncultured Sphaerochaeta sp.]